MRTEEIILNEERNVRLTALLQEVGGEFGKVMKRPAVIVLPGGAYSMCSDREADPVAMAFAKEGYQAFVLRYTTRATEKELIWPHPIEDYDEAFDLIRANAEKWAVDMNRIVTCGFSAGGHLAACTATIAKNRPAAAILGYPAILEGVLDACAPNLPRPVEHIDGKTPPCFIFIARDDNVVNVKNATAFADALEEKGVMFELHVYSYGGHGFTTALPHLVNTAISRRARNWVEDSIGFLEEVWGQFNAAGFTDPEISRTVNGNYEDRLSVNCTLLYLEQQGDSVRELLRELLADVNTQLKGKGFEGNAAILLKSIFTLKSLLEMLQIPTEKVKALDIALKAIPNKR